MRDGVIKILRINDDKVDQLVDEGKLRTDIDIFHDNRILYSLKDISTILNESFSDTLKSAIKLGLTMMSNYGVIFPKHAKTTLILTPAMPRKSPFR